MSIKGIYPALITPFQDGRLDIDSFKKHVEDLKSNDIHGVVVCGTTGEGPTVSKQELSELVTAAKVFFPTSTWVGTGTNATQGTIDNNHFAEELSADGVLVVTPYYNKPTQEGLYLHFKAVAENTKLPIMLYNVPGRTSVRMTVETTLRLAAISNITCIKDATGDMAEAYRLVNETPSDFSVFSGEDALYFSQGCIGFDGLVSVTANIAPKAFVEMYDAIEANDLKTARSIQLKLEPLCQAMFCETNPIPVKYARYKQNKIASCEMRLPLTFPSDAAKEAITEALTNWERA